MARGRVIKKIAGSGAAVRELEALRAKARERQRAYRKREALKREKARRVKAKKKAAADLIVDRIAETLDKGWS